ncbi:MAG: hypothetical protein H0W76_07845 [Pyrinomonadaceae bacterium]|nr:hypothetical protein [Pyrinomonadaceae bacterium]
MFDAVPGRAVGGVHDALCAELSCVLVVVGDVVAVRQEDGADAPNRGTMRRNSDELASNARTSRHRFDCDEQGKFVFYLLCPWRHSQTWPFSRDCVNSPTLLPRNARY